MTGGVEDGIGGRIADDGRSRQLKEEELSTGQVDAWRRMA